MLGFPKAGHISTRGRKEISKRRGGREVISDALHFLEVSRKILRGKGNREEENKRPPTK